MSNTNDTTELEALACAQRQMLEGLRDIRGQLTDLHRDYTVLAEDISRFVESERLNLLPSRSERRIL